jgi:CelD/BcsL family acetyltransferase involved in cellulose biosynthesis
MNHTGLNLQIVDPQTDQRWDDYVQMHPEGLIYHHSAWLQVLVSSFGYQPYYLAVHNGSPGEFQGVLPLMMAGSKISGLRLISLPFTSHCTPLLGGLDLAELVGFLARQCPGLGYLELRFLGAARPMLESCTDYVTHTLDLGPGPESLFKRFHPTSIRQRIKRAERNGLKFRLAETESDLKQFFKLHIDVRKKHGLPPHRYAFFSNMWRILKPKGMLLLPLVEHDGRIVAGATVLRFRDTFIFEYSASDQAWLHLGPNQLLIWEVIKLACSQGATVLDLGRSAVTHSTLIEFKSRWGALTKVLTYSFYPKARRLNSRHGLARRMLGSINRLLPNRLLQLEGELIYGHLA